MEGMGICETRLEHFKAAEGLLEQAKRLCMKKALGREDTDDVDVEEINDTDGAVASVGCEELVVVLAFDAAVGVGGLCPCPCFVLWPLCRICKSVLPI